MHQLKALEKDLSDRVMGQDRAVLTMAKAVCVELVAECAVLGDLLPRCCLRAHADWKDRIVQGSCSHLLYTRPDPNRYGEYIEKHSVSLLTGPALGCEGYVSARHYIANLSLASTLTETMPFSGRRWLLQRQFDVPLICL